VADSFAERIDNLIRSVGTGDLVGSVVVDQVYAHYQEVGLQLKHPRGGNAGALGTAVDDNGPRVFEEMAAGLLEDGPTGPMRDGVERIADVYAANAPREFANLSLSAHPSVTDNGTVIYDRPPSQPRLTEDELKALNALRLPAHERARMQSNATARLKPFGGSGTTTPFGHGFNGP
jgi:hypothetical protein